MAEWFLDTSYAIALASRSDQNHGRALELADRIETGGVSLVTTRAVLLEIGNSLAKQRFRTAAVPILNALEHDPDIEIVSLSEELYARAAALYEQHDDKEWGLTDCVSFVVMRDRGLSEALTADGHFRQAGFRALLATETS